MKLRQDTILKKIRNGDYVLYVKQFCSYHCIASYNGKQSVRSSVDSWDVCVSEPGKGICFFIL